MNQAIRTLTRFAPVSTLGTLSRGPAPLTHPIATRKGFVVEAVRYLPHEDDPRATLGANWIVRERDQANNVVRESTELYSSADQAYDAYWTTAPAEFGWEAWVAPIWATFICRCGCRVSADENPCELEYGEKCSITSIRERA